MKVSKFHGYTLTLEIFLASHGRNKHKIMHEKYKERKKIEKPRSINGVDLLLLIFSLLSQNSLFP
jgi:hypothetical protein